MSGLTRHEHARLRAAINAVAGAPSGVPRSFAAHADGQIDMLDIESAVRLAGVSAAASAGYDIMTDDGVPPETAWKMALSAERDGKNPEAFARHLVSLRKALRS